MTHVLIASLNYAPEETGIGPYATGVAEHFAALGYGVSVVTGMPHYPAWRIDAAYANVPSIVERRNGVRVYRSRHYVPASQTALLRGLYEASSLSMALTAFRLPRPDAVLGIVPSLSGGLAGRAAAARFRVPYGLVFQDLAAPAATQSDIQGAGAVSGAVRAAEGWVARGAAAVGIVAGGFRPYIESLGVDPAKIRRVRNWTRHEAAAADAGDVRERLGWPRDAFVCLHAGNMGHKQALENVIECARLAAAAGSRLHFVLMGDGNQRAALEGLAARHALPNLQFLPLQAADAYAGVLRAADALLLSQGGRVRDMSLPSKLTSYFAAGRPVIAAAAIESEAAREITDSGAGIVVAPDRPRLLLDAIQRLAADPGLATYLSERGTTWARDVLSREAALRSYEQMLATVLRASPRGRVIVRPAVSAEDQQQGRGRWAA